MLGLSVGVGCRSKPADRLKRADAYFAEKKYAEAIVEYRAALQQDAKLGEARLKLADSYVQLGDGENAFREYIRSADTLPDNADAQLKAGAMLLLGNRFAEAKVRADSVLRKNPRHSGALMLLGNALAGLNDVDGALRRLNQAVDADPNSELAHSSLGALQLTRGDMAMAEASFKKAISANPNAASARVALATFYRSQNRDADVEAILKEASRVDPRNVQVNANLVELFIRTGRPRDAEAPLKAIVEEMHNADAQFALAEYYLRLKRLDDAVPILQKLSESKDTASLARARLAAIAYKQGRTAEAHTMIDGVLRIDPKNRAALLLKGQLLSSDKKFDAALALLKAAALEEPARAAEPNLVAARIYVATGHLEEAEATYKQVLIADPSSISAQIGLSQLYAAKGEIRAATELARGAVTNAPNNAEARLTLVRTLLASGDTATAERELKVLQDNAPPSAALKVQLGTLQLQRNNMPAARAAFNEALALSPGAPEALAGLVALDLTSKNQSGATDRVAARLKEAPDDRNAWYLAAHVYFGARDFPNTEKALRKTIELDPTNLSAYAMLGGVYGAQGKLDDAKLQFDAWAQQEPRSVAAHTMVAMLLERQNKVAEATKAYEKILEIDPRAAVAANNLAFRYADSGGNLDLAMQLAQTANSQLPDEPEFSDTLGWVYYQKDLPEVAIQHIQRAIAKAPKNPQFHYHLGLAYAKQGEDIKAAAALKHALALNPTFPGAGDATRVLGQLVY